MATKTKTQTPQENVQNDVYEVAREIKMNDVTIQWQISKVGKNQQIVLLHDDRPEFDDRVDYNAIQWESRSPLIAAIKKWAEGGCVGSAKLIVTAPTEKAEYEAGTGSYGYVRHDYIQGDDAIVVEINGNKTLIDVMQDDVPSMPGFRRLSLAPTGDLYARDGDPILTARGEYDVRLKEYRTNVQYSRKHEQDVEYRRDYWYWYVAGLSMLAAGKNIKVAVNGRLRDVAQADWEVLSQKTQDDIRQANNDLKKVRRTQFAVKTEVTEKTRDLKVEAPNMSAPRRGIMVPLAEGGETDLTKLSTPCDLHVEDEFGGDCGTQPLVTGSPQECLALQQTILELGWKVRL